ncbi:putative arsenical pump-driving ATPase [Gracilariopsis chorda]|uniref:Putative arsenical pump-driving ATPase n=1 Tax=Gracilariopsis chorda TaxID=448386 RepID=A0A2V3IHL6_9FLOR|nr:putative arsenical pump-driving ATPase [Gracilariopsis chorda]|eukprot:PXF40630.1 putative arsenical pump-driving ATPase [Gracilariopsis chorda]
MEELRDLVRDKKRTQFAVVTVMTGLAMAESERLVKSLEKDCVMVENLIINQIIGDTAATAFVRRIIDNQSKCIEQLREAGAEKDIELTEVPYFDVVVRGAYGLQVMAKSLFSPIVQADWRHVTD